MKKLLLVLMGCVMSLVSLASHIVGGEFEIIYRSRNQYQINLILYFDLINGLPGARDNSVMARIYRKSDNFLIRDIFLPLNSTQAVSYTQPSCSKGEVKTDKLIYSSTITMDDVTYGDPQGYYIVWERCCRNYTITNIYSRDPLGEIFTPFYAGQTFYLEFPPVVKNGEPFINSSPQLFPPLNDYGCPRKPYYADFAGSDLDGDSLVYTVTTPLNTQDASAIPQTGPRPAPYPTVKWQPGFGLFNIMQGAPDLKVSTDGLLTVTPTRAGLFVFAVKCEEFRDGVKIGELRRDFQMLVVGSCPVAQAPVILGKKKAETAFTYQNTMNVDFPYPTTAADRCITVQVSDADALSADDNFIENIRIKAIPIGFKKNTGVKLPQVTQATLVNGSVATFEICFDECPPVRGPFTIGIVAFDDACSLPLFDTLKVTVNIGERPNRKPRFVTANVSQLLLEGDAQTWPIRVVDDDGDSLKITIAPDGFPPDLYGMTFNPTKNVAGEYVSALTWETKCDIYNFNERTNFAIKIFADDFDQCLYAEPDTMVFNLAVKLPGNFDPILDSDLVPGNTERFVTVEQKVFSTVQFNLTGTDADNDYITLKAIPKGFALSDFEIDFTPFEGNGPLTTPFQWNLKCENLNLKRKDTYEVTFVLIDDRNKCQLIKTDTLDVKVKILPPDNLAPELSMVSLDPTNPIVNDSITIFLNQQLNVQITATDADLLPARDGLSLKLLSAEGKPAPPTGYVFAAKTSTSPLVTTLGWNPDCSIFLYDDYSNDYKFVFRVTDDRCFAGLADTVTLAVTVNDIPKNEAAFIPPNVVTPNNDGKNDYFAMVRAEPTGEIVSILPSDNCVGSFVNIAIYNRWGKEVYKTEDRNFKWYPTEPSGQYFYLLNYSNTFYKGIITIAGAN